jgi:hypothetical protein
VAKILKPSSIILYFFVAIFPPESPVSFVTWIDNFLCFNREVTTRVEEVFHDNGTVSYKNQKFWYFLPEGK